MRGKGNLSGNLVSVITPAYNCEQFIGDAIDSVLDQTYKNWEMIIVNDNSTDNTRTVVEEYAKRDKRIKLFNQPSNQGAAAARNKAIEISQGRFIAFLDSDDGWKPEKLQRQIKFMLDNKYGFTFTSYEIMSKKQGSNKRIFHAVERITYEQYLKNTIIGCSSVILDKEILGYIEVESGYLEDVLTWMKYLKQGHIAYGITENLGSYRVVKQSVSSNKFKNGKRYFWCLRSKQNLSLIKSLYCQFWYMFNAVKKRVL